MKYARLIAVNFLFIVIPALVGCGGSNSAGSYTSSVNEVSFRDKTIEPNAQTTLRIHFDPGADITGFDSDGEPYYRSEAFAITVFVPNDVLFVSNGSRLSEDLFGDVLFGNPDPKQPIEDGSCADGRRYVRFFFDENELTDSLNTSLSSIYLKIDVIVPPSANGKLAGANISWSKNACEETIEERTTIVVRDR